MTAPIKNGGPAFPTDNEQQNGASSYHYEGMTLRDYFAAKAMQAFAGMSEGFTSANGQIGPLCIDAYAWADAMLKARSQ